MLRVFIAIIGVVINVTRRRDKLPLHNLYSISHLSRPVLSQRYDYIIHVHRYAFYVLDLVIAAIQIHGWTRINLVVNIMCIWVLWEDSSVLHITPTHVYCHY